MLHQFRKVLAGLHKDKIPAAKHAFFTGLANLHVTALREGKQSPGCGGKTCRTSPQQGADQRRGLVTRRAVDNAQRNFIRLRFAAARPGKPAEERCHTANAQRQENCPGQGIQDPLADEELLRLPLRRFADQAAGWKSCLDAGILVGRNRPNLPRDHSGRFGKHPALIFQHGCSRQGEFRWIHHRDGAVLDIVFMLSRDCLPVEQVAIRRGADIANHKITQRGCNHGITDGVKMPGHDGGITTGHLHLPRSRTCLHGHAILLRFNKGQHIQFV